MPRRRDGESAGPGLGRRRRGRGDVVAASLRSLARHGRANVSRELALYWAKWKNRRTRPVVVGHPNRRDP